MIESLINTVIQGDCLDVMKSMPDKCVDLVLTDPPYGINVNNMKLGNRKESDFINIKFDEKINEIYFQEIFRISKKQIIFGGNYYILPTSPCWLIWDKNNGDSSFSDGEMAWTNFEKPMRIKKVHWCGSASKWEDTRQKVHPTQKPVALFQWILQNYSEQGMTIFDPFAGSGTTAIACLETGRNYILVEKESEYVEIINKRISQWKEQGRLFPAHVI